MVQRNALTLIAIVLIGVFLVGPSLISGFGDLVTDIGDWVKYGWDLDTDDLLGADNATDAKATFGIGLEIHFADGTKQTFDPEDTPLLMFPMTMYYEDKEVTAFRWKFHVKLNWAGTLTKVDVNCKSQRLIDEELEHEFAYNFTYSPTATDPMKKIEKNKWKYIHSSHQTADAFESLVDEGGPHTVKCLLAVDIVGYFITGKVDNWGYVETASVLNVNIVENELLAVMLNIQTGTVDS